MARDKYSRELKYKILSDLNKGERQISIAKKYNINRSIVSRLIKKFKSTNDVTVHHLGGPPRKTTDREDRKIVRIFKKNPFSTSKEVVKALNLNIHDSTVRRRAIENNLKSYRPCKKPLLTKRHKTQRLNFAKEHLNWTIQKWKTVLFSDESKFNLINSDGMCTVRRKPGKRLEQRNCKMNVKHGGGSVMVWTCFSADKLGPFHQIDGIMDRFKYRDILETQMIPHAKWNMPLRWTFQHDNDPKHTSKLVKDFLRYNRIQVLDWPAQFPDLNPIENMFGILKRSVAGKRFRNKGELFQTLKSEWEQIPESTINNIVASMPRRCADVIRNKGCYTKY